MKALFLTILIFILFFNSLEASRSLNKIVAVVGEEVLTLYELDLLAEPLYEIYLTKDLSPEEREKLKQKIRRDLLDQWIEDTLIGLEAKKYGIKVSDEELNSFLREELKGDSKAENISKEEREKIRERLVKIKFIQIMVRDKIAIPEEDLKKAYQEKLRHYESIPKYHLEILIIREEALVNPIYEALLKGRTFDFINREYREQTQYIREVFKEEELDRGILEKLLPLKPGEITDPIKRGEVYQILRLAKRETGTPPSFEEARKELYEELFQRKAQAYLEKWIKELKETKFIKIYL
ncbi:MAG: SurA N-terminal domain-containing protein [Caldimicrobium sp.]|nr:SurA N-terminal domain-containing protein [Caldimicrobium sp.]MCX7613803.1 SurA N-terminal domain-containing protein [Caldimicrobium sp.]MDW8182630.1 SurA N-terminal domain-containing protein [Caldimicrobium sp.]